MPRPERFSAATAAAAVESARSGGRGSRAALLERFREPLLGRIRLMLGDEVRRVADSGDFLHDVLLDFLDETRDVRLESDDDVLRWLTAAARNRIRDAARRGRVRAFDNLVRLASTHGAPKRVASPSTVLGRYEEAVRVAESFESLTEEQRAVIERHDLDGESLEDVARLLGKSYESTKKLHSRAVIRLGLSLVDRRD